MPAGYTEDQRGAAGGFIADPDVMDTWATSSLTPQIAGRWTVDDDLWSRLFPFDVRPQSHEIIRTWLFSTVTRAHLEDHSLPFRNATISGWVLDPDRKKMSKSRGNVVTPIDLLDKYGSDAARYWAANGRPGVDTAFDEKVLKVGRRLATKLLNATKFALRLPGDDGEAEMAGLVGAPVTEALDRAMLAELAAVVTEATTAFDAFDYARALERTEGLFWRFTDDYLELVKGRAYGDGHDPQATASARATLATSLHVFHRLFAPHLAFASAEVWSWWQEGHVHLASWPTVDEVLAGVTEPGDAAVLAVAADTLGAIRRTKTEAKRNLRTPVLRAEVTDTAARLALLAAAAGDVTGAGVVTELITTEGDELSVTTELAPPED